MKNPATGVCCGLDMKYLLKSSCVEGSYRVQRRNCEGVIGSLASQWINSLVTSEPGGIVGRWWTPWGGHSVMGYLVPSPFLCWSVS